MYLSPNRLELMKNELFSLEIMPGLVNKHYESLECFSILLSTAIDIRYDEPCSESFRMAQNVRL